jgi:hypothetical protein
LSRRVQSARRRNVTIVVCTLDALAWAVLALGALFSGSDAATRGLDELAGIAVSALLLVTAVPAIVLTALRRAPTTALVLASAFPAAFAAAFVAALVAW